MIEKLIAESKDILVHVSTQKTALLYFADFGIGYMESNSGDTVYDEHYYKSYLEKANTPMGISLNDARCDLTISYNRDKDKICDVGVGGLAFVKAMGCSGFDVNPYAIADLKTLNLYGDPYETKYDCITMWDVIEHINDPKELLDNTNQVILSTPIYTGFDDIISSKHFKPNEHIWYFTDAGVKTFMKRYGFDCVHQSDVESKLGRHSIGSYVFVKSHQYQ